MAKPFARAHMLFALITAAMGDAAKPFALITAAMGDAAKLAALPEYTSRGKGKGLHTGKKWGPRPSYKDMVLHANGLWYQEENGAREVARRVRQGLRDSFNAAAKVAREEGFPVAAAKFKRMALDHSTVSGAA